MRRTQVDLGRSVATCIRWSSLQWTKVNDRTFTVRMRRPCIFVCPLLFEWLRCSIVWWSCRVRFDCFWSFLMRLEFPHISLLDHFDSGLSFLPLLTHLSAVGFRWGKMGRKTIWVSRCHLFHRSRSYSPASHRPTKSIPPSRRHNNKQLVMDLTKDQQKRGNNKTCFHQSVSTNPSVATANGCNLRLTASGATIDYVYVFVLNMTRWDSSLSRQSLGCSRSAMADMRYDE